MSKENHKLKEEAGELQTKYAQKSQHSRQLQEIVGSLQSELDALKHGRKGVGVGLWEGGSPVAPSLRE